MEKQTNKQVPLIRLDLYGNIVSAELITVPNVAPKLREYRNVDAQQKAEFWRLNHIDGNTMRYNDGGERRY